MKRQLDCCCLNFHATRLWSGCNQWLVRSSCGLFCGFELDLESLTTTSSTPTSTMPIPPCKISYHCNIATTLSSTAPTPHCKISLTIAIPPLPCLILLHFARSHCTIAIMLLPHHACAALQDHDTPLPCRIALHHCNTTTTPSLHLCSLAR